MGASHTWSPLNPITPQRPPPRHINILEVGDSMYRLGGVDRYSVQTEDLVRMKLLSYIAFFLSQHLPRKWQAMKSNYIIKPFIRPFDGSIHAPTLVWGSAKTLGTQEPQHLKQVSVLEFIILVSMIVALHLLKRRGSAYLQRKDPRGWDSGLV